MKQSSIAGALVDCTIIVIAFLAWRIDPGLQNVFLGILCSMAGARVALIRKGPPPPGSGGDSVVAHSAALALVVGLGALAWHLASRQGHSG